MWLSKHCRDDQRKWFLLHYTSSIQGLNQGDWQTSNAWYRRHPSATVGLGVKCRARQPHRSLSTQRRQSLGSNSDSLFGMFGKYEFCVLPKRIGRSEEHTSELQSRP